MPNNPRAGGISRRIDSEERDTLRDTINQLETPDGMGVIVRTAGVGKSVQELQWDLNVLLRYWEAIKQAAVIKPGPYLIHQESDAIMRAIRDHLRQDISEIVIDEEKAYTRAQNYITQIRPDFMDRLKYYSDHLPLFSRFQIERQIETAYQHEVRLPSGGSIVIDITEALVSIDINSARATKGSGIEETALNTNLEAADEIARQLRLRDMGGLIVIDFIDMTPVRNQREVENRLREAVRQDRARIQIGRISRFGLLEMSRQRLRSSLNKASQVTCSRCNGQGTIRSVESLALSVIHLIQEKAATSDHAHLQAQVPVNLATYLLNEKRNVLKDIEVHTGVHITIIPNSNLQIPNYHLRTIHDEGSHRDIASYRIAKIAKAETVNRKTSGTETVDPAINEFLSSAPSSQKTVTSKPSFMDRLRKLFLGDKVTKPTSKPQRKNERKTGAKGKRPQRPNRNQRKRRSGGSGSNEGRRNVKSKSRRGTRSGRSAQQRKKTEPVLEPKTQEPKAPESSKKASEPSSSSTVSGKLSKPETTTKPDVSKSDVSKNAANTSGTPIESVQSYQGLSSDKPLRQVTTKTDPKDD